MACAVAGKQCFNVQQGSMNNSRSVHAGRPHCLHRGWAGYGNSTPPAS
eukprot:CAMPEP_0172871424 /NCGR_PEP_ID=MMETSP1075-20121228/92076_1 /TAXON_ID=2916 /ORGANISM="Ceratium fusus, Strain PA161109" /LENGTH=47 /DNA_ID= /DNA_START= /DNA_END= /DNA_ORIENTATION=